MAGHLDVYQWLTVLQEYLVLGLMGKLVIASRAGSAITDVAGIRVGHHHRIDPDATLGSGWATRHHRRADAAGHGRRGRRPRRCARAPGRPTCSTRPTACGTSTRSCSPAAAPTGLAAADGVMRWLEEHGRGVAMDGGAGADRARRGDLRPAGRRLAVPADRRVRLSRRRRRGHDVAVGTVGAGVGARAGVLKGGVGTASVTLDDIGVTVGAVVAVNSAGNVADPATGLPWMARPDRGVRAAAAAGGQIAALRRTATRELAR